MLNKCYILSFTFKETFCNVHCLMFLLILFHFLAISFMEQKVLSIESFVMKKIHKNCGINFHEWQDDTYFLKNKLSQICCNQILQMHKFSQGWNIYIIYNIYIYIYIYIYAGFEIRVFCLTSHFWVWHKSHCGSQILLQPNSPVFPSFCWKL